MYFTHWTRKIKQTKKTTTDETTYIHLKGLPNKNLHFNSEGKISATTTRAATVTTPTQTVNILIV